MRLQPPAAARARVTAVTAVLVTAMQAVVPRAVMAASVVQSGATAVAALATAQHTKTVAPVWVTPPSAPSAMPWNMRSRP